MDVLIGLLISLAVLSPVVWAIATWMCYSIDSTLYEFGKYTTSYRCVECNQVYRTPKWTCEKCGHEHSGLHGGMKYEVGKWHCKLSRLTLVYWWEPKNEKAS
jgi:hypothetical protein